MAQRQFRNDDSSVWADRFGNSSDGVLTVSSNTTDATANTSITGTSGGTSATVGSATGFANGNLILIHQTQGTGSGNWELNKISSGGATTSWTLAYTLTNTYGTGAQVYLLKQYSSVTVNSGVTLTAQSWNGTTGGILALLCDGTATITGSISANSKGFRGGTGAHQPTTIGQQGEGTAGVGTNSTSANGNGGGGGSSNNGGSGGGNGAAGSAQTGSSAGATGGAAALTTMVLGGGGGGGGNSNSGGDIAGDGGPGGGVVFIISKTLTISGAITTNGENGSSATVGQASGGAGGAGGSVLVKAQKATLGTTLIVASAGTGGSFHTSGSNGAAGGVGRNHADYGLILTGTTTPTLDSRTDTALLDIGNFFFSF